MRASSSPCTENFLLCTASELHCRVSAPSPAAEVQGNAPHLDTKQHHESEHATLLISRKFLQTAAVRLTTLAEMEQSLPVALQVLVDGVTLVIQLQALQHVQEREVLFRVLQEEEDGLIHSPVT